MDANQTTSDLQEISMVIAQKCKFTICYIKRQSSFGYNIAGVNQAKPINIH